MAYSLSHKNIFPTGCNNASGGNFPKNCGSKKRKARASKARALRVASARHTARARVELSIFFDIGMRRSMVNNHDKKGVASRPSTRVTDF